ncbi:MAG: hypothetical protein JXA24_04930 [Proteobacteria bacterium]|nr:hypothetical protein [Pseudomonadota bacterium]
MHIILTGEIDSGKSSCVQGLVTRIMGQGREVGGWITPAHTRAGIKAGHDFVAIDAGGPAPPLPFTRARPFQGSFPWRRFHFNRLAFERTTELAERLCRVPGPGSRAPELFVMDELGPLELEEGKGFLKAARRAISVAPNTLTVVRKGLEERLIDSLGITNCTLFAMAAADEMEASLGLARCSVRNT